MSSSNLPNKLRDIPVFIGNPWVRVINLLDEVEIVEPVTAEVWFSGVNQPSIVVTPIVEDKTITVTLTTEQIALLPSRHASLNIKFGDNYVLQQKLTPTYEGAIPEDVVEEYDTPGLGIFRVSYYSDATNAAIASQKAQEISEYVSQAEIFRNQAEEFAQQSESNSGDYYPRGYYNAAINQANGTTALSANSSAWNTGNPGGKQARLEITTPGAAAFVGANFALGATIGPGYLVSASDNKWIFKPDGVADLTVTIPKLGNDVKAKNLPWLPTATNSYGDEVRAAIKDVWLYNVDRTKDYHVGVFGKKPLGSTQYVIQIYQGATLVFNMAISLYVPASNPDIIRIQGSGNTFAVLTVDWDAVVDGTSKTGMTTSHAGISPFRFVSQDDNLPYLNRKVETISSVKARLQPNILSRTDTAVIQNTTTPTIFHGSISAIILSYTSQNLEFDTFSFPGHNFTNADAAYAFCLVKTTAGAPMMHVQPFDKRTADYTFLLSRSVNLNEGVKITFGYMSTSGQSFAPGTNLLWAAADVDANLSSATISYLNLVSDVFGTGLVAVAGWSSSRYKLSKSTNVILASQDNSVEINKKIESQPLAKAVFQQKIVSRVESTVIENTASLTIPHTNISAIILTYTVQNLEFDTFSFPGHNFTNANAVYAFCLIRTNNGAPLMHVQYFDKRTTDYVFLLSRMVNLNEGVRITFGYLSASGQSFAPGVSINVASAFVDSNLSAATINYLNLVSDPFSNGLTTPAGWASAKYKLSKSTNVVLSSQRRTQAEMKFVLPSKLYPLNDSQLWFYANTIIKYDHLYRAPENGLRLSGRLVSGGTAVTNFSADDDFGQILGTSAAANVTFELLDRRNINDVTTPSDRPTVLATKVVNVTPKTRPTGNTWNCLAIGDSFMDSAHEGVGMLQKIIDFGAAHSNTINFRGIRTPNYGGGAIKSEARGSWSENTFFRYVPVANRLPVNSSDNGNLHSPFMFSPDDTAANAYFSFSEYMTTYGGSYGTLNAIFIALGTNPGSSPAGTKINEMVASIRAWNATIPIIIATVAPGTLSRRNMDCHMEQTRKMEQTEAYMTLFDGRDAEFIYLCPWHAVIHRLYGLQNVYANVAKFADQNRVNPQFYDVPGGTLSNAYRQQQTKLFLTDIHPSAQGIYTYADALYDTLCYVLA